MSNQFKAKKILIVEDNLLNQKLMQMVVEKTGHKSIAVSDGSKAFDTAKKEKPALILLDIKLPEVSGIDIAKMIRKDPELKKTPIIVITSFADKKERERISKETNCDQYLTKPFLPDMLTKIIGNYLPINDQDLLL